MCAVANLEQGYAEFRLKSIFYVGDQGWTGTVDEVEKEEKGGKVAEVVKAESWENKGPMQGMTWYGHKLYTKLWMECGLSRVKR